jgi:hypothetical protein
MSDPQYLQLDDLRSRGGTETVERLFSQAGSGGAPDPLKVNTILVEAEHLVASELLRAWSADDVTAMMKTDEALRGQAAWVALELASESKHEFIAEDGWGRYKVQYERAMTHFKKLADGRIRTRSNKVDQGGANAGGRIQPRMPANERNFVFAPSNNSPKGQGGF